MRFTVSEAVRVTGKGVVLCGRLEAGTIRLGDRLFLAGGGETLPFVVGGIDVYGRPGLTEITGCSDGLALLARGVDGARIAPPCVVTEDGPEEAPAPVWPPAPRVAPPMGPLPPLTPREVFGLCLYWLLVIVGVLFAGAMLVALVLVLAALVDLERHWR